jgi:hypothetical protein
MKKCYPFYALVIFMLVMVISWQAVAQDDQELSPVSRAYALTRVNIIQAPGRKIEMGTVVIKNGLIQAVGKNVPVPADAILIRADSMYVYAGFVDGLSHAGMEKPRDEHGRDRPKDPGNPPPDRAGITPQHTVHDFLVPSDRSVEDLRAVGFAAAHVVPYGKMMPGNGSVVLLGGQSANAMLLSDKFSFYSELTPAERVYPTTVMGVMAKWRELYQQAVIAKDYQRLYTANPSGIERPVNDEILESFYPVIDRRQPVFFKAEKVLEIQRILTLQKDLGFTLMLGEVQEAWDLLPKIRTASVKIFLSLALPEEKKTEKADTSKKTSPEGEALEKRRSESLARYVGQAAAFQRAGIKFGFSTLQVKPADIPSNLRKMIAAGLSEDVALASLTTIPADFLGVSDRLGSVDQGKIANLVVTDKPYFHEKAKVRYVFVDGQFYKIAVKESKPADPNVKAIVEGEWLMTTEMPQGKMSVTLIIKKEGSNLTGQLSGGQLPQPITLDAVEVEGTLLKFTYTVTQGIQVMKTAVEAKVEGTTFKGNALVGAAAFPVEGKKVPKPL